MRQMFRRRSPFAMLGNFSRLGKAVDLRDRPPAQGEHFRTRIADTWDGIRFEIGRMIQTVQHAIGDPLVIDQAGWNLSYIEDDEARRNPTEMARVQFQWVRGATQYVPDPYRMEKLQTPNRMIRMSRIPKEIVMAVTAPIYAARSGKDLGEVTLSELPELPVKISADCDEMSCLAAALAGACGIRTRFMLGRLEEQGDGFHHVWAQADVLGDSSDDSYTLGSMDATEPEFDDLGKYANMGAYKPVEIWK